MVAVDNILFKICILVINIFPTFPRRTLEIETSAILGNGFLSAIMQLGASLSILMLNCEW